MTYTPVLTQIAASLADIHQVLIHLANAIQANAPIDISAPAAPPNPAGQPAISNPEPANGFEPPNGFEQGDAVYVDFEIDTITSSTDDNGRPVFKGRGHPYEKYGVRIWPEVFQRLGVNVEDLVAGENQIHPVYARCVLNENGNPRKIVGIAPGRTPEPNNNNPVAPPHPEPYPDRDIRPQPADDEIPF